MSSLDKKQLDFLKALAELFYEKIRPDTRFRNKRIGEWYDGLPLPPTSTIDSSDQSAIDKIAEIHQQLERIDDENAVKGYKWGGYIINEFSEKLDLLSEKIKNSEVDPSIYNLFHVHNSVLLRAQGKYEEAIEELAKSSSLLQKKIDDYEGYLPRYTREIFMNIGASSELYRLSGRVDDAIVTADRMHMLSMKESEIEDFVMEDKRALCLSSTWALYFCCEAHLAVENWDDENSKRDREWYFTHTFGRNFHKEWTVPVLIRIIGNVIWEQRYPEYFESIADLVYIDTAQGSMKKKMREASVFFGRIRLKPTMPFTLLTFVALLTINSAQANQTDNQLAPDYQIPIVEMIDQLEKEGISIDAESRDSIQTAVQDEINTIISAGLLTEETEGGGIGLLADREVGVGIRGEAYKLLAETSFASDRGVGVG